MRTRKMRLLSFVLAVAMMFTIAPVGAFALAVEQTDAETQLKYTVENDEVTITGYAGTNTSFTIPEEIAGKPVVAIGDYAFNADSDRGPANTDYAKIQSVHIDANLRSIGQYAFRSCKALNSVNIPTTVTTIGTSAFDQCSNLVVAIPNGVTSIGTAAFRNSAIEEVVIPNGWEEIPSNTFANCTKLSKVTIPEGVKQIQNDAFNGCSALKEITIPASVTYIAGYALTCGIETLTLLGTPKIESYALGSALKTVNYNFTQAEWNRFAWVDGNIAYNAKQCLNAATSHYIREIKFNLNGHGKGDTPESIRIPYDKEYIDSSVTIPTCVDDNYKFLGWATTTAGTAAFDFTQKITNDVTVYAAWNAQGKVTLDKTNFTVKVGDTELGNGTVPKFTYDGKAKTATASGKYGEADIPSSDITVKYYELGENNTETLLEGAPSKVGHYLVKLDVAMSNDYKKAENLDGGWKFDIVPRDLTDTETGFTVSVDGRKLDGTGVQVKYTGNDVEATATPDAGNNLTDDQYEIEYYDETGTNKLTVKPKEPGKYVVKIRVKATENTNEKLVTNDNWKFEIVKADLDEDALGFVVKVDDKDLSQNSNVKVTYTGNDVEADVTNTANLIKDTDYTVEYYKDGSTTPETNLPKEPGNYVVKIRVNATDTTNEKLIAKDSWKFEIVKKALDENNFELVGDKKWTEGDEGKNATVKRTEDAKTNGVGDVTEVKYYPVNEDGTLGDGSTSLPTKPGKYQIGITVADSDHYEGGELTSDKWQFEIEEKKETPAPNPGDNENPNPNPSNPDDNTQKKVTITITDGELYVNGEKKPDGTAEVAEGDTVRIKLPEEKKTQGELVFGGWVLGQEELLDALKEKGFAPGAENTEFTVPALPEDTQLTIRAQYVTPEQAGQSDDFISTAAAVVGGAALTGFVAWQGYNIFAEVYMKQYLPVLPQNRQELALALWQDAEKPAAVETALYTDVDEDDADAQTAARWAVENELLKPADKDDENVFKPYKAVSVGQVYRAWNKAQKLKQQ